MLGEISCGVWWWGVAGILRCALDDDIERESVFLPTQAELGWGTLCVLLVGFWVGALRRFGDCGSLRFVHSARAERTSVD